MDSFNSDPTTPKKPSIAMNWAILVVLLVVAATITVVVYANWRKNQNSNVNVNINATLNSNSNVNGSVNVNAVASNTNMAVNTNAPQNINSLTNMNVNASGLNNFTDSKYNFGIKYPSSWRYQKYTNGYNDEGPYVIAFTTGRSNIEVLPFISVRDDWSAEKEAERINAADPPYTKVTLTRSTQIGDRAATILEYSTTAGTKLSKTVVQIGSSAVLFGSAVGDVDFAAVISTFQLTD